MTPSPIRHGKPHPLAESRTPGLGWRRSRGTERPRQLKGFEAFLLADCPYWLGYGGAKPHCCMMVSDGRVSTVEKATVIELLKKTGASLTPEHAEHIISRFISGVQRDGFNTVLRNTRERIKKFKELGKEDVLLRCLSAVAKADGTLHDAEKKVYNTFAEALKEPIA